MSAHLAPVRILPLTPEQLADAYDDGHARRAWWLDLHSRSDLFVGTTISDIESAVIDSEKRVKPEPAPDQSDRAWPCPKCGLRNNPLCDHKYHTEGQSPRQLAQMALSAHRCGCGDPRCNECSALRDYLEAW